MATPLEKARVSLILNEPFFASIALKLDFVENKEQQAMETDGRTVTYNPKMFEALKPDERTGLLVHIVMHITMMHHLRIHGRDKKMWNVACDHAINHLLKSSNFKLPQTAPLENRFRDKNAESIYDILKNEADNNNGDSGGSPPPFGEVTEPQQGTDLKEMEQEVKQMILEATNAAKQAGKLPGFAKGLIEEFVEPKQPWRELLQRFISTLAKNDYSWKKPNPRYLPAGMYLPALYSEEIGGIVFAIDTSNSISNKLIIEFASEIREAASIMRVPVTVIQCDSEIKAVFDLDEDDSKFQIKGRGGTAFQPVFDYVIENLPETKALVYFTDGDAFDRYSEPPFPILWAIYENKHFTCDFGEIIIVQP